MIVVGQRGRELGGIMIGWTGIYQVVVTLSLVVHFQLELLSGVPLGVGLLEARQGCCAAVKDSNVSGRERNASDDFYR